MNGTTELGAWYTRKLVRHFRTRQRAAAAIGISPSTLRDALRAKDETEVEDIHWPYIEELAKLMNVPVDGWKNEPVEPVREGRGRRPPGERVSEDQKRFPVRLTKHQLDLLMEILRQRESGDPIIIREIPDEQADSDNS